MDNVEKDNVIIQKARDYLDNRSQPYIEGAWEDFVEFRRKRKRRRICLKYGIGAAACLSALFITFRAFQPEGESFQPDGETTIPPVITESHISPGTARPDIPLAELYAPEKHAATQRYLNKGRDFVPTTRGAKIVDVADPLEKKDNPQLTKPIDPGSEEELDRNGKEEMRTEKTERKDVLKERDKLKEQERENWKDPSGRMLATSDDKVRIGLNISPTVHSATSNAAFAFSGGITADIKLTRSLFVTTGLLAEHQQFSSCRPNREFMGIDKSFSGDMVSIDIPLNIGWKFTHHPNRNYYIVGGVSSLAYVSENYQSTERWQEVVEHVRESGGEEFVEYEVVTREATSTESAAPFQNFHPFGRLNLMVGVEQKINSGVSFHVEPYLKIPLSGVGDEAIRITTGGVNFKVSF
jgi:hypothetical protein